GPMSAFVIRRVAAGIVILFVASFLTYVLVAESGDPLATLKANPHVTQSTIDAARARLGLDHSLLERYWLWLSNFVQGDFGKNTQGQPVEPQLWQRLGVTMKMVIPATVIAAILAIALGILGAVRHYKLDDHISTTLAYIFYATPVFVLGILLKDFVAINVNNAVGHTVVYTVGDSSAGFTGGFGARLLDNTEHAILPVLTLVLVTYAAWSRYQRASLLDVMNSDYVRFARAKGVPRRRLLIRHALRNALIPLTTVIALDFAVIIGGAVITEIVYGWEGMGQFLLGGLTGPLTPDVNTVQAWLVITAAIVVLFNLLADITYAALDPRIRYG
ncbi:MAG TPA: ABC transporter permease, partial [Gaiellaceae bacterium]|nr:ABC transporter permease [Gaiellaceae bacterium]